MKPSTSTNILTKPWIKSQTKDYNFNLLEQTLKNKVNLEFEFHNNGNWNPPRDI